MDAPRHGIDPSAQAADQGTGPPDARSGLRIVLAAYFATRALAAVAIVAAHLRATGLDRHRGRPFIAFAFVSAALMTLIT